MGKETVISLAGLASANEKTIPPGLPSDFDVAVAEKPIWQRAIYPPRMSLNGLLIGILFSMAAVLFGFVSIPLPSVFNSWLINPPQTVQYTMQLSWLLMTSALLGPFMGPAAVLLFLIAGLALLPIFASGGGWQYVFEPGAGYLFATLPVGSWLAKTFHKALQKNTQGSCSLKLLQKALIAVLMIHVLGGLYLVGLTAAGVIPWHDLWGWIFHLGVEKISYDLLATIILLALVRQIRLGLWLILY